MPHAATRPISQAASQQQGALARLAIGFTAWAEKWFPGLQSSRRSLWGPSRSPRMVYDAQAVLTQMVQAVKDLGIPTLKAA